MDASDELLRGDAPSALLTLDGVVSSLNAAMAMALDRTTEQCLGRGFGDLWPADQRFSAENLVTHAAAGKTVAMRALEFPGSGEASVACLIEARPVKDPARGTRQVWVHALDAQNDLASLLIPFLLAAKANNFALWLYTPHNDLLEWMGGASLSAELFAEATSVSDVMPRVHPDDREALRQLLELTTSSLSPWVRLRYLTEHEGWHHLAAKTRRIQLGYGGPERILGLIRDDTEQVERQERLQAALSAERGRAKEIGDISSALFSAATEQELQQVILTRLAATFGGAGALLALVEEDRLCVSTDAGIALWEVKDLQGMSLHDLGPLQVAILSGKSEFIPDRKEFDRRWSRTARLPWIGRLGSDYAVAITPLGESGDQPLGAWMVVFDSGYRPALDDWAFMTTLGDLAGQALKRIRLQQAHLELATALQQSMLPTLPAHLPGLEVAARYHPSQDRLDIGGDWYDAFALPDGTVALEIGDVQGHDVDAAAFMGQVRLVMRAIATHAPAPGTVLTRTNELIVATDSARFASCSMLHLDPREGQVTGTNAGHVPVLCAHKDGSHTIQELPGGPVLGVAPDIDYPEETFTLGMDSALVMVTDGVVEGPGLTLDAGLERAGTLAAQALRDGLNAEGIADRVLDTAVAVDHADDVAVLVIRRT
ncbi:SpoIIE family protein phosphatase [Streptomyces sp. NPDC050743]|uniref:SpoIIE family protein phosphatase n=1 Tax=Streptomyces sp. NPDC050743 TaxID=3365634 RepID=UPI00378D96CE